MFFESDYKILSNEKIAKDVYKMRLEGDTSHITAPGQFVNIKLDGKFLRRPISVCDCEENVITIIYKVVGEGTEQMSNLKIGKMLNVLTGLGNGYDISKSTKPLLIGGGVGVPPMYFLAKKLIESGQRPCVGIRPTTWQASCSGTATRMSLSPRITAVSRALCMAQMLGRMWI